MSQTQVGQIYATLTSFGRVIEEYNNLAKQEIVAEKREKAFTGVKEFRTELSQFRDQFERLRMEYEQRNNAVERNELMSRRHHINATITNQVSVNSASASGVQQQKQQISSHVGPMNPIYTNEQFMQREDSFIATSTAQLDEYLERGRLVLADLAQQRDIMKGTQRRLLNVAHTLGVSGDTIRTIERRIRQDAWIFWLGVLAFFTFAWAVLHYLH